MARSLLGDVQHLYPPPLRMVDIVGIILTTEDRNCVAKRVTDSRNSNAHIVNVDVNADINYSAVTTKPGYLTVAERYQL